MTPIPASQCALHNATPAAQWVDLVILITAVRRAWLRSLRRARGDGLGLAASPAWTANTRPAVRPDAP